MLNEKAVNGALPEREGAKPGGANTVTFFSNFFYDFNRLSKTISRPTFMRSRSVETDKYISRSVSRSSPWTTGSTDSLASSYSLGSLAGSCSKLVPWCSAVLMSDANSAFQVRSNYVILYYKYRNSAPMPWLFTRPLKLLAQQSDQSVKLCLRALQMRVAPHR